ncbi:hypothetical protein D9613_012167 [Agrocybe pediades]|uniref:Uncharacterized protein n=1 Tax=Agrocybe pediades TaxID=84607 RepID=A0A8H4R3V6_9AGAR|nr:hypothetical protein D9613_012167 [Agrocybe pediades]
MDVDNDDFEAAAGTHLVDDEDEDRDDLEEELDMYATM